MFLALFSWILTLNSHGPQIDATIEPTVEALLFGRRAQATITSRQSTMWPHVVSRPVAVCLNSPGLRLKTHHNCSRSLSPLPKTRPRMTL